MDQSIAGIYQSNIQSLNKTLDQLNSKRKQLGWLRLLIIIASFAIAVYFFPLSLLVGWSSIIMGIAIFLVVVSIDSKNNTRIAYIERLVFINQDELSILQHAYKHRNSGIAYLPKEHAYAADLDLFGEASLFQYLSRCTAEQSERLLADLLLHSLPANAIIATQQAVAELAPLVHWRQNLQAAGMQNPIKVATETKIANWKAAETPYNAGYWKWITWIYSIITLSSVVAYFLNYISEPLFVGLIAVYFITGMLVSRKITPVYGALSKIVKEISTLQNQLQLLEDLEVKSPKLIELKEQLHQGKKASEAIHALQKILNRFDFRLNVMVFFILNSLLLWDLRQLLSLTKWKHTFSGKIETWFSVVSQIEVLHSLASMAYNHPGWVFPAIAEDHFTFSASNIGHPLIAPGKMVANDYATSGAGKVSIITGSNMAGKSTFLRSVGVNIVLAQMGSVVCASAFKISPAHLHSSMRVADNLAENTSTFYAELKKLKSIIEEVANNKKVIILLDEILRGTNSLDRHTGTKALIKQLIRERAVAIIATHDVALAELEKSYITSIKNYHFDVQVEGEELYFDYKLKSGVCQSLNASILMKKIGIDI